MLKRKNMGASAYAIGASKLNQTELTTVHNAIDAFSRWTTTVLG
jgi:hypothetical protein